MDRSQTNHASPGHSVPSGVTESLFWGAKVGPDFLLGVCGGGGGQEDDIALIFVHNQKSNGGGGGHGYANDCTTRVRPRSACL